MSKRPKSLVMGAGERPPNVAVAVLTLQHAALALVFLVYAVLIGKGAGFTSAQQQALVNGTLLACGLGAVLHARGMPWGSGLLAIPIAGPVFMPVAIQAGVAGGPAGVAAVVLLGGLIQWLTGGLMRRIRVLFPPEVCGVVVMMLGVSLLPGALRRAVGIVPGAPVGAIQLDAIWISLFTLAAMVAVSIWLRGGARFFAMLLGCAAGLLATLASRGLSDVALAVGRAEWLAMPELAWPGLSLNAALIPVVLLLAVVSAIDGMGVLIGTDRLDDAQWFRPNLPQLAAGIRAVGTTNVASALLGGTFTGLSGSNLGLAFATGVTSRVVGLCVGVALMAACFLPKLTALVLALPEPVLGGILLYASAYFLVSGADLALSRMLSQRRMLVIGLALAAGIATQAAPEVVRGVDGLAGQIVRSPLALAALVAVALNALFRIGIATSARIEWTVDRAGRARLREALSDLGEQWGLHRETVRQADDALTEAMDLLASRHDAAVPLVVDVRSDEMHLYLRLEHGGAPVQFPERAPTPDELLDDPDGMARMSAWILRQQVRRVSSAPLESPRAVLTLVLEN